MDPRTFDRLTRLIGSERSRRGVLKTLAGGAFTAVASAFGGEAAAHALRSVGNSCVSNNDCASGRCVQEGRTRKICHCGSPADCPLGGDQCHAVVCLNSGVCGLAVTTNAPCDDGNACTQTDACDSGGTCVGGNPVLCHPLDQCHVAGACAPATGICSNPAKADGSPCGSGQLCCGGRCCPTASDICVGGGCCTPDAQTATCAGKCGAVANNCGQPVACGGCDAAQCLTCGDDHTCVSTCGGGQACCGGSCKQAAGSTCAADAECCSGVCVEGVCEAGCSTAGGPCDSATDCCEGTNCIDIVAGVGTCCAGTLACGGTCCTPDTACQTASCAGNSCSYSTRLDCCLQDRDCPVSIDPCRKRVCDTTTNTCGTAPAADNTSCGTGHVCCGGSCVNVATDAKNCGGCGATCTANVPCSGGGISLPGCCETGVCSAGSCATSSALCGRCATATCDPVQGSVCVSHCPPPSPSDLCHTGEGICQIDSTCAYPSRCAACETCDSSTGACSSNCGACEQCDRGSGQCVSTCGRCQVCDEAAGTCRACATCETCDSTSGQCVSTCNSPSFYCAVTPGTCVWNPYTSNWACQYDSMTCPSCHKCDDTTNNQCLPDVGRACGACSVCDQQGNCVLSPAGASCGVCQVCSGFGGCQIAPQGTACGVCRVCDFGGNCGPAPAGAHDSGCAANKVCDGSGNCGCAFTCGGACCSVGAVDCCDLGGGRSVCCPKQCVGIPEAGTSFCPTGG